MWNRAAEKMNFDRKVALAIAAVLAVAGPLAVGLMNAPIVRPAGAPKARKTGDRDTPALAAFEVASIKPSAPDSSPKIVFAPGGKLYITNATPRFLIKIAYDIGDDQLTGALDGSDQRGTIWRRLRRSPWAVTRRIWRRTSSRCSINQ
jgi:hypothetical protein